MKEGAQTTSPEVPRFRDVESLVAPCLCGCARRAGDQETLRLAGILFLSRGLRGFGSRWATVCLGGAK